MSTLKFNTWLNTDNTENYKCRAWVNFNGTGTVAIRASGNVSSITDLGTGVYRLNFTTSFSDTNYALVGTAGWWDNTNTWLQSNPSQSLTASVQIASVTSAGAADSSNCQVAVFR